MTVMTTRRIVCIGITLSADMLLFGGVDSSVPPPICAVAYWEEGYRGEHLSVLRDQSIVYVGPHWNDQMSSVTVFRGCICTIYRDSGFLGGSRTFDATTQEVDVPSLGEEWNKQVSSVRCLGP